MQEKSALSETLARAPLIGESAVDWRERYIQSIGFRKGKGVCGDMLP